MNKRVNTEFIEDLIELVESQHGEFKLNYFIHVTCNNNQIIQNLNWIERKLSDDIPKNGKIVYNLIVTNLQRITANVIHPFFNDLTNHIKDRYVIKSMDKKVGYENYGMALYSELNLEIELYESQ